VQKKRKKIGSLVIQNSQTSSEILRKEEVLGISDDFQVDLEGLRDFCAAKRRKP